MKRHAETSIPNCPDTPNAPNTPDAPKPPRRSWLGRLPVGGLFWKIMAGFCLTVTAVSIGIWLWFTVLRNDAPHVQLIHEIQQASARNTLAAARTLMETGGQPALERFQSELVGQGTLTWSRVSTTSDPLAEDLVWSPDGQPWQIHYVPPDVLSRVPPDTGPPAPIIVLYVLCGLLYSIALAWYLTAPLQRLQRAFDRFGAGDLAVRTAAGVQGRHDEIAELSRDFDAMAARISRLVEGRERLLHDVSHELRSPLARLHVAAALARQEPARIGQSLNRIEREAARLNELVAGLLTLSRIESGTQPVVDHFDLRELCEAVAADADFEGSHRGVRIRFEAASPAEAPMRGNLELIRRAVENVMRNALHVSASGQTVTVSFVHDTDRRLYRIHVSDEGPGVPPRLLETMFEPFVQAQSNQGGFGLGLSIAQRSIAAHGGTATAANRVQGGLEVSIVLPAGTSCAFSATAPRPA
ncbi:two-component system, OmpR family, sensor kinase [Ralstonia sp. 25mfcol4.1]|uniref:ATP-binding protein n=1 Tax=Ralstonia sp. 25mfcol4.1 TaxID=1761899 RepID=UPI0004085F05|nr:ATP-binding protein [Ralstonia sp. 25mfcol4.1]SDP72744.1 two-component system, OmpR family, sensor kinase [Ralstonia sp. 25mfcol4.1]